MTVTVSFIRAGQIGSQADRDDIITRVRARETIAVSGTTTETAEDGELILIANSETSMIRAAIGTTPDADAMADNGEVTSAGFSIPAGLVGIPIQGFAGAKVNVELDD